MGSDVAGNREILTAVRRMRSDIAETKEEIALLRAEIKAAAAKAKAEEEEAVGI